MNFLRTVWRWLNRIRLLVLNVLFLFCVVVVLGMFAGYLGSRGARIQPGSVLLLNPLGGLAEQAAGPNPMSLFNGDQGSPTMHYDVLRALRGAATDKRIAAVVIKPSDLGGSALARVEEINAALAAVRASGKPVLAWGDRMDQVQYLLAANAGHVYLDPDGEVSLVGLARQNTYFHALLEKLGVKIHVFRVGTYKSAVEPYTRDSMSDEDKLAAQSYLGDTWERLLALIVERRKLDPKALHAYSENTATLLRAANGNGAEMARNAKLVDSFMTGPAFDDMIKQKYGADESGNAARYISVTDYTAALESEEKPADNKVGVVVVEGVIMDGPSRSGIAGSDTVAKTIRSAVQDKDVKAIVLRVNSPGGSASASEQIRRELQRARDAGKPVIVSMASVAASGGYWIAMSSDQIWADATTITGSIGIFGMIPEIAEPLANAGIHVDGIRTAPDAGQPSPLVPLSASVADQMQQQIAFGYQRFINTVSKGRHMSPADVDAIAQGRVWTGKQALDRKLVDHLGGLDGALSAAAKAAKLSSFKATYVVPERSPKAKLIAALMGTDSDSSRLSSKASVALGNVLQELDMWSARDNLYARCLCDGP